MREPRIARTGIVAALSAALILAGSAFGRAAQPFSVAEGIESTRFVVDAHGRAVITSPDGRRYVVMLVRGDLQRNGVEMELVAGELGSLARAKPRTVTRLFTSGLGADQNNRGDAAWLTWPGTNAPRWIDAQRVAFLWEDAAGVRQVVAVDTITGEVTFLTRSSTDVLGFAAGPKSIVVYRAGVSVPQERSKALIEHGFAVTSRQAAPLLAGYADGTTLYDLRWNNELLLADPGSPTDRQVRSEGGSIDRFWHRIDPVFSPDGRLAVISKSPDRWPAVWRQYRSETLRKLIAGYERDPDGYLARQLDQLFVLDVEQAMARPLWNVPIDYYGERTRVITWSPDSKKVLVAPTLLPISPQADGEEQAAAAVVDVRSGEFTVLAVPSGEAGNVTGARWRTARQIQLELASGRKLQFHLRGGKWILSSAQEDQTRSRREDTAITIEVRQDINSPPVLVAVDSVSGAAQVVLDPNPRLREAARLAHASVFEWTTPDGRAWEGRLYYPSAYREGQRYPLVVQTHGVAERGEFSLYGPGSRGGIALGPGVAGYLAQALATRGIAVLQVPDIAAGAVDRSREPVTYMRAYEAAIHKLVESGLVDREKVGLYGYSGTGWHVEYALAHSDFPYAAAIVGQYRWQLLSGWLAELGASLRIGSSPRSALRRRIENLARKRASLQRRADSHAAADSGHGYRWRSGACDHNGMGTVHPPQISPQACRTVCVAQHHAGKPCAAEPRAASGAAAAHPGLVVLLAEERGTAGRRSVSGVALAPAASRRSIGPAASAATEVERPAAVGGNCGCERQSTAR